MAPTIRPLIVALSAAALLALSASPALAGGGRDDDRDGRGGHHGQIAKLRNAITVDALMQHEQALQNIATANGGTRASGTPGYQASVDYIVSQLESAGYDPVVQPFDFAFFQELAPPTLAQDRS